MKFFWLSFLFLLPLCASLALLACNNDDDNSNDDSLLGTWTDPFSGLTWQLTSEIESIDWNNAISYCEELTLAGGGWHLPTISELRSLIRGCAETMPSGLCGITDSCLDYNDCFFQHCWGCGQSDGPLYWPEELQGYGYWYWSSSQIINFHDDSSVWGVNFKSGGIGIASTGDIAHARCVRQPVRYSTDTEFGQDSF